MTKLTPHSFPAYADLHHARYTQLGYDEDIELVLNLDNMTFSAARMTFEEESEDWTSERISLEELTGEIGDFPIIIGSVKSSLRKIKENFTFLEIRKRQKR